jgi:hypothetical protein
MLAAAILSAELRADGEPVAVVTGLVVSAGAVVLASLLHRQVRRSEGAQLGATVCLGLAAAPIELAARLPLSAVLAGTIARLAIFAASSFLVRSAFARSSSRRRRHASSAWQGAALLLLGAASAALGLAGRATEARACAVALAASVVLAWWRPTAKQLKPLGLSLAGVALVSAVALAV